MNKAVLTVVISIALASVAAADITIGFEGLTSGTQLKDTYSDAGLQFHENWFAYEHVSGSVPARSGNMWAYTVAETTDSQSDFLGSFWFERPAADVSVFFGHRVIELTVNAYGWNNALLDTQVLNVGDGYQKVDFGDSLVKEIEVTGTQQNSFTMDDLTFRTVPVPGSLALVAVGLCAAGLAGLRKRRR